MSSPTSETILQHLERRLSKVDVHKSADGIAVSSFIALFQIIGASTLFSFVTHRIRLDDFRSIQHLRQINLPRLYLVLLFLTAWCYFVMTGFVLQGIGPSNSQGLCTAGIYLSASAYALSKVCVYLFLAERAYVVWCPTMITPRYKSPVYRVCAFAILCYFGVICNLFVARISILRADGMCMIGFRLSGAIPLLVYDICVSILLTGLFIWPLVRMQFHNQQLQHIARRSVIAASLVLSVSCVNIVVLAAMHGRERGFICLLTWEADVFLGSITMFWLTSGNGLRPMVSIIQHADSGSASSSSKRYPTPPPDLPFLAHGGTLPTVMDHGAFYGASGSSIGLPSPALTRESCAWAPPPLFATEREIVEKSHSFSASEE
ncbi:hypothetical protein PHLGIDRAFT_124706 [Phlebiopsis gigantea 11061_1 CR5-6]|uniref:G-protein coupled receptors family 1 profile domain-containing protein n=1 Tax=Phlebiopsis gigantea (strain 11061_1 CR5-6) TaxID=745531 RepID=A0A0C3SD67_PHLG1|nr:hypothetical protein PHLGIDRAFT_124706 [Phlebiopsis gigantea 11061_1 CR5-6]